VFNYIGRSETGSGRMDNVPFGFTLWHWQRMGIVPFGFTLWHPTHELLQQMNMNFYLVVKKASELNWRFCGPLSVTLSQKDDWYCLFANNM